jgi:crossover junction endodeoxyribonuclease RusA
MTFTCKLPWPPTVNNYYTVARGRKIISKKGRQFKSDCSFYITRLADPMKANLQVEISVCMPDKRRRDLDNLLKPILDALGQYGVYEDDSQIVDLRIKKIEGKKGEVLILIKEIQE